MSTGLILALHITEGALEGGLVGVDGRVEGVVTAGVPGAGRWHGFRGVEMPAVLEALRGVCAELARALDGRALAGVALSAPRDTLVVVGSENRWLTPALFGRGVALSASEVPEGLAEAPPVVIEAFRRSPLRQLQARLAGGLDARRVASLGAAVVREMSRAWIACLGCEPTGMPYDPISGQPRPQALWAAVGIWPRVSPLLVPAGGVMAQLDGGFARATGLPTHTPIVATGDGMGALALALGADVDGWCALLDDSLQAAWLGPGSDDPEDWPEAMGDDLVAFQIHEDGLPEDARVRHAVRRLRGQLEARVGPVRGQRTFALRAAPGVLEGGGAPLEGVAEVGPGCEGLRFLPGRETGLLVGLRAHHDAAIQRAARLEGAALELRRWRHQAQGVAAHAAPPTDAPLRLALGPGWPPGAAQRVADLMQVSVEAVVDDPGGRRHRLSGSARAAARSLGLASEAPEDAVAPDLETARPDPAVAPLAGRLAGLHAVLMQETARVLH